MARVRGPEREVHRPGHSPAIDAGREVDAPADGLPADWIEDLSWDGVWDAVTRIDSLGWTAEFRVPFSQLRFGSGDAHTFGFGVWRDIARRNERVSWPVYRKSRQALASQASAP